jgi:hypothetical protein
MRAEILLKCRPGRLISLMPGRHLNCGRLFREVVDHEKKLYISPRRYLCGGRSWRNDAELVP